ncbi:NAD(P)H-hydrate dehydratase [Patescibacteria group bacterium]|nr:NAD(P)H-hydrate dehydratase [Patescibacteria group bacterium]MBU2543113.1 NAD(P)H-hydrate dehydratase [Patescibacteria group bacterium]
MRIPKNIRHYLDQVKLPAPASHKGQNGRLLIIGGSELFHAASQWSLDIASKFVDMVFYSSIPSNNELVREAKASFLNGIVVPRNDLNAYIVESDCILIGPGMDRDKKTADIVNNLLSKYADKKWVVDAGALQMVNPVLLNSHHIITPHHQELQRLMKSSELTQAEIQNFLPTINQATLLLKGPVDQVFTKEEIIKIEGGNAGMTKGGTGDVLAGIVAALYCTHDALTCAVVGSFINKKAGESLYHRVGPYYNASDLVNEVPKIMWASLKR